MILFFDTETTGLPKNWKAPITDLDNWPRMVQLAYIFQDIDGNVISQGDYLIKPDGYSIPIESTAIHGISTERAIRDGKEIRFVLEEFNSLVNEAEYIVAHNINFDEKIIGAELLRIEMQNALPSKRKICTMESSTNFCAIDGPYGYKWPKLSELHYKLFLSNFEEAHNAAVDIVATEKCFWELKKKGIIELSSPSIKPVVESSKKEESCALTKHIKNSKEYILNYCKQNNYNEIPFAAKAKAIMHFEYKCKQVSINADVDNEFIFLHNYWAKNEDNFLKQTLNEYQIEFILSIKMEVIEEHKIFFNDEKYKTIEKKIIHFETLALLSDNDKTNIDIVKYLYDYYLIRYRKFLPIERRPTIFDEKETDYSNYSIIAKKAHENFETLFNSISSEVDKLRNNGDVPEFIYTLVLNCSKELTSLELEVGTQDKLYKDASFKIIDFAAKSVSDWTKACYNALYIPVEGLIVGNTYFDVCISTINELDKIETDENTKSWFNNIKASLNSLRPQPKSGCYIATMAYGNYDHPQVMVLRNFRDKYLLATRAGKYLVTFYYWLSPKLVSKCKDNIFIKKTSKRILDFMIKHIVPR